MKNLSLFILFSFLLLSCDENSLSNDQIDLTRYTKLEKQLTTDFDNLATGLRGIPSNLNDKDAVINVVEDTYGRDSELYSVFF